MDLPNLQAGMQILADQINQISREVRSNAITAFNGGKFQRTTGGTSLSIDQGINSGSSSASCPFRISNATNGTTKKIRIDQNTVNVNTGARWPQGMGPKNPPYEVTITDTSYIYIKLVYVTDDVIVKPDEDAITVAVETELKTNTVDEEYVLIGIVAVYGDAVAITNQCTTVTANPCNLAWGQ